MIHILTNLLSFAFALGVIIIVHEAGHLMVAKAFGIRVMTFSIGFGSSLFSFRRGETEYRISAVPLGGYVRLGGENPEESTGDPREFMSRPRWQRVLVYLAGPAMNILFSILLCAALFMVGIEIPTLPPDVPPLIGAVEPGSSAAAAHLQRGDLIVKVNGEPAPSWQEVSMALLTSPEKPVTLEVKRGDKVLPAVVTPRRIPRYEMGDFAGLFPLLRPQVVEVVAGQPAAAAGFRAGDEIRAVDGVPVANSADFVSAIEKRGGQRIQVQVVRNGRTLVLPVVPKWDGKVAHIGVNVSLFRFQHYPPGLALVRSVDYNVEIVRDTFQVLGKIFRRQMSPRGALAGPIEIAKQSGDAARAGQKNLFLLMGFLSVSIAILNLMPIPILDGGQIFILLLEEVIRRDLSLRVKEVISQVGFVLILMLMVVVFWFDLTKNLPAGLLPGS